MADFLKTKTPRKTVKTGTRLSPYQMRIHECILFLLLFLLFHNPPMLGPWSNVRSTLLDYTLILSLLHSTTIKTQHIFMCPGVSSRQVPSRAQQSSSPFTKTGLTLLKECCGFTCSVMQTLTQPRNRLSFFLSFFLAFFLSLILYIFKSFILSLICSAPNNRRRVKTGEFIFKYQDNSTVHLISSVSPASFSYLTPAVMFSA